MDKDYILDVADATQAVVDADREVVEAKRWRDTRVQALKDLLK